MLPALQDHEGGLDLHDLDIILTGESHHHAFTCEMEAARDYSKGVCLVKTPKQEDTYMSFTHSSHEASQTAEAFHPKVSVKHSRCHSQLWIVTGKHHVDSNTPT